MKDIREIQLVGISLNDEGNMDKHIISIGKDSCKDIDDVINRFRDFMLLMGLSDNIGMRKKEDN